MIFYYITDRKQFSGTEAEQRALLLNKIAEAARSGVDFIQLREKDLSTRELEQLAREAVHAIRENSQSTTRLLINSRLDIAIATGADGVHLTSTDINPSDARALWQKARSMRLSSQALVANHKETDNRELKIESFLIAVSCHTPEDVARAESHGADFAVFAPVFEKTIPPRRPGLGLDVLREACRRLAFPNNIEGIGSSAMPVLALGGVNVENAQQCIIAGASGIAAIRLFQDNDIEGVIQILGCPNGKHS